MLRGPTHLLPLALLLLLASCDTVDLGATPADVNACRPGQQYFMDHVWPDFLAKDYGGQHCYDARCHDPSSGRLLVLTPPTSAPALPLPADWAALYKSASAQTECTNATASPLVARPDGDQPHGGGMLIAPDGPEVTLVKAWITAN
jgi:hypothetical protein